MAPRVTGQGNQGEWLARQRQGWGERVAAGTTGQRAGECVSRLVRHGREQRGGCVCGVTLRRDGDRRSNDGHPSHDDEKGVGGVSDTNAVR